jgi:hypothetical protein
MTPLETALAALAPRPASLDRDRLMFLAGERAAARRGWLLPCSAAIFAAAVTLVAVLLLYQPPTRIVYVEVPQPQPPAPSSLADTDAGQPPTGEYLLLRNRFLAADVDALPRLPPDLSSGPDPTKIFRPHMLPRDDFGIPGGPL